MSLCINHSYPCFCVSSTAIHVFLYETEPSMFFVCQAQLCMSLFIKHGYRCFCIKHGYPCLYIEQIYPCLCIKHVYPCTRHIYSCLCSVHACYICISIYSCLCIVDACYYAFQSRMFACRPHYSAREIRKRLQPIPSAIWSRWSSYCHSLWCVPCYRSTLEARSGHYGYWTCATRPSSLAWSYSGRSTPPMGGTNSR